MARPLAKLSVYLSSSVMGAVLFGCPLFIASCHARTELKCTHPTISCASCRLDLCSTICRLSCMWASRMPQERVPLQFLWYRLVVELFIEAPCQWLVAVTKISLFMLWGLIGNSLNIRYRSSEFKFKFLRGCVFVLTERLCKGGVNGGIGSWFHQITIFLPHGNDEVYEGINVTQEIIREWLDVEELCLVYQKERYLGAEKICVIIILSFSLLERFLATIMSIPIMLDL